MEPSKNDQNKLPTIATIAELCFSKFKALPKTGKPSESEWTVLAGIVQHSVSADTTRVVALGCGTKCLGATKMCVNGLALNDSHAEVLARRAFLRYLLQELQKAVGAKKQEAIFEWNPNELSFHLKVGITFHFLSTQTPCGDACIVAADALANEETPTKRRKTDTSLVDAADAVFTGAKLIGQHADAMEQTAGALRIKPGKGDRTLCMSCSDKLSKWNVLGVQGALLDMLLESPIYISTFNFCCNSRREDVERAIYKRWQGSSLQSTRFEEQRPEVRICSENEFDYAQNELKQPSPNGLAWCDIVDSLKPYEISVNGKRQGVTSKKSNTPQAALKISRFYLFKNFQDFLRTLPQLVEKLGLNTADLSNTSYLQFKQASKEYQTNWTQLKNVYFKGWTTKPTNLQKFSIKKVEGVEIS